MQASNGIDQAGEAKGKRGRVSYGRKPMRVTATSTQQSALPEKVTLDRQVSSSLRDEAGQKSSGRLLSATDVASIVDKTKSKPPVAPPQEFIQKLLQEKRRLAESQGLSPDTAVVLHSAAGGAGSEAALVPGGGIESQPHTVPGSKQQQLLDFIRQKHGLSADAGYTAPPVNEPQQLWTRSLDHRHGRLQVFDSGDMPSSLPSQQDPPSSRYSRYRSNSSRPRSRSIGEEEDAPPTLASTRSSGRFQNRPSSPHHGNSWAGARSRPGSARSYKSETNLAGNKSGVESKDSIAQKIDSIRNKYAKQLASRSQSVEEEVQPEERVSYFPSPDAIIHSDNTKTVPHIESEDSIAEKIRNIRERYAERLASHTQGPPDAEGEPAAMATHGDLWQNVEMPELRETKHFQPFEDTTFNVDEFDLHIQTTEQDGDELRSNTFSSKPSQNHSSHQPNGTDAEKRPLWLEAAMVFVEMAKKPSKDENSQTGDKSEHHTEPVIDNKNLNDVSGNQAGGSVKQKDIVDASLESSVLNGAKSDTPDSGGIPNTSGVENGQDASLDTRQASLQPLHPGEALPLTEPVAEIHVGGVDLDRSVSYSTDSGSEVTGSEVTGSEVNGLEVNGSEVSGEQRELSDREQLPGSPSDMLPKHPAEDLLTGRDIGTQNQSDVPGTALTGKDDPVAVMSAGQNDSGDQTGNKHSDTAHQTRSSTVVPSGGGKSSFTVHSVSSVTQVPDASNRQESPTDTVSTVSTITMPTVVKVGTTSRRAGSLPTIAPQHTVMAQMASIKHRYAKKAASRGQSPVKSRGQSPVASRGQSPVTSRGQSPARSQQQPGKAPPLGDLPVIVGNRGNSEPSNDRELDGDHGDTGEVTEEDIMTTSSAPTTPLGDDDMAEVNLAPWQKEWAVLRQKHKQKGKDGGTEIQNKVEMATEIQKKVVSKDNVHAEMKPKVAASSVLPDKQKSFGDKAESKSSDSHDSHETKTRKSPPVDPERSRTDITKTVTREAVPGHPLPRDKAKISMSSKKNAIEKSTVPGQFTESRNMDPDTISNAALSTSSDLDISGLSLTHVPEQSLDNPADVSSANLHSDSGDVAMAFYGLLGNFDAWLFQILTEKNRHYKARLEKEEAAKQKHIQILRKTHEVHLQENRHLIQNLEDIISEQAQQITVLKAEDKGQLFCTLSCFLKL